MNKQPNSELCFVCGLQLVFHDDGESEVRSERPQALGWKVEPYLPALRPFSASLSIERQG